MKKNLVIGYPLQHSLSPILHNYIYKIIEEPAKLKPLEHTSISFLIDYIKNQNIKLTAVTLPFKEEIIKYLDWAEDTVEQVKACNTIIQKNNKLFGYNTDIDGISFALKNISLQDKKVLVLGAGGAARALGFVLQKHKSQIYWYNRTIEKAYKLADEFKGHILDKICENSFDIIINTTPIGMHPHQSRSPLPDFEFNENHIVFDMIYNPQYTTLLKAAKCKKAIIISGLDMFIAQGLRQIELFTKRNLMDDKGIFERLYKILNVN